MRIRNEKTWKMLTARKACSEDFTPQVIRMCQCTASLCHNMQKCQHVDRGTRTLLAHSLSVQ